MTSTTKPTKQQVRDHMDRRTQEKGPPPSPDAIRRELGWHLLPNSGRVPEVPD